MYLRSLKFHFFIQKFSTRIHVKLVDTFLKIQRFWTLVISSYFTFEIGILYSQIAIVNASIRWTCSTSWWRFSSAFNLCITARTNFKLFTNELVCNGVRIWNDLVDLRLSKIRVGIQNILLRTAWFSSDSLTIDCGVSLIIMRSSKDSKRLRAVDCSFNRRNNLKSKFVKRQFHKQSKPKNPLPPPMIMTKPMLTNLIIKDDCDNILHFTFRVPRDTSLVHKLWDCRIIYFKQSW